MHTFSITKKVDYSAPIFFMPLGVPTAAKVVMNQSSFAQKQITPTKITPTSTLAPKTTPAIKQPTTTTIATNTKKIEEKKTVVSKTPTIIEKKNVPVTKQETKQPEKKEPLKTSSADIKEKPKITQEIQKEPVQSTVHNKEHSSCDKVSEQLAKSLDIQQPVAPIQAVKETRKTHPIHVPENAHISNNYREVEALRCGTQLQKELVHKWQPPIGVSPECTCEISFCVNTKGTIENLKMVKSSGVVMFDISARQALFSMKMPQWTHGKYLTINFKQ